MVHRRGCVQEASVSHHMGFSAGLLECPHIKQLASPGINDRRANRSHRVFCDIASEVTRYHYAMFSQLDTSSLFRAAGATHKQQEAGDIGSHLGDRLYLYSTGWRCSGGASGNFLEFSPTLSMVAQQRKLVNMVSRPPMETFQEENILSPLSMELRIVG